MARTYRNDCLVVKRPEQLRWIEANGGDRVRCTLALSEKGKEVKVDLNVFGISGNEERSLEFF